MYFTNVDLNFSLYSELFNCPLFLRSPIHPSHPPLKIQMVTNLLIPLYTLNHISVINIIQCSLSAM